MRFGGLREWPSKGEVAGGEVGSAAKAPLRDFDVSAVTGDGDGAGRRAAPSVLPKVGSGSLARAGKRDRSRAGRRLAGSEEGRRED